MIFVIVGFHYQGFDRLIRKMDEIAGRIDEPVIMQIGHSKYIPKNAKYFNFKKDDEIIKNLMKQARIIISHGGAGTILDVLHLNKPLIVVPKLRKFKEHIDNQQMELAEALERERKLLFVTNIDKLENAIEQIKEMNFNNKFQEKQLINYLKKTLQGA